MLILRFIHDEDTLFVGDQEYKASCRVRNELNGDRLPDQVVKTWPTDGLQREPYYPRKFPTGLWRVNTPIWTDDPEYAPVKIPTDAIRRVLTWDTNSGQYSKPVGHQSDSFYHLHFAKNSRSTLGCIRLNSDDDAADIANKVSYYLNKGEEVWLEVIASRRCY